MIWFLCQYQLRPENTPCKGDYNGKIANERFDIGQLLKLSSVIGNGKKLECWRFRRVLERMSLRTIALLVPLLWGDLRGF
jgi:hypothetical protein